MCLLDKYCFYLELKTGVYLLTVGYGLYHVVNIVFSVILLTRTEQETHEVTFVVVECLLLVICALLFLAAYKENVCLTFLTLFADFLQIIGFNTYRVFLIILGEVDWLVIAFFLWQFVLDVYVIMVILSFHDQLVKKRPQSVPYIEDYS